MGPGISSHKKYNIPSPSLRLHDHMKHIENDYNSLQCYQTRTISVRSMHIYSCSFFPYQSIVSNQIQKFISRYVLSRMITGKFLKSSGTVHPFTCITDGQ